MKDNGVIYCRVSTKEQAQNLSLSTQQNICSDYCKRQGIEIDRVFVDAGESAKTVDRPEFQKLLTYCRDNKGRIKYVVVYQLSRFSRNTGDHFALRTLLSKLGITLRSATEATDETPSGKLVEGMLAVCAQFDNDVRAARTVAGMKAALEKGRWTFQAPLGYLNSHNNLGEQTLIFDPERAPTIQHAFDLCASGQYSKREIISMVTAMGLCTRKGRKLSPQTCDRLLRNTLYSGWIVVSKVGEAEPRKFCTTCERGGLSTGSISPIWESPVVHPSYQKPSGLSLTWSRSVRNM